MNGASGNASPPGKPLRCIVFRGLPKELEEDVNKFLECTPCEVKHVLQSEDQGHVTMTLLYVLDPERVV